MPILLYNLELTEDEIIHLISLLRLLDKVKTLGMMGLDKPELSILEKAQKLMEGR